MTNTDDKYAHKVAAQQVGIFETPVAYCQINEGETFLQELERRVRERMHNGPGLNRSNAGGWHSDTNMLQWGGLAAERLARSAIKICKKMSQFRESSVEDHDWSVRMWANVTPKGGFNNLHAILAIYGPRCCIWAWDCRTTRISLMMRSMWKIRAFRCQQCKTLPFALLQ